MSHDPSDVSIAIIGGGFTGAAVAWHLAQSRLTAPGSIAVFEPRENLGTGLAYGTQDDAHRINVPATRMSLLPDDLEHFSRWAERFKAYKGDPDALGPDGHHYPRRSTFGIYMHSQLSPHVDLGHIRHIRSAAASLERASDGRWKVTDTNGFSLIADTVVIATSHPAPVAPGALSRILSHHKAYVPDATLPHALNTIGRDDRVLIIGNGLTSADVIASLSDLGHRGPVLAISRRGLRSRAHAATAQEAYGDFTGCTAKTAVNLLRRIRSAIIEANALGLSWHSVLDAVRSQGQEIWQCLPLEEQRRIVRHLRPFWDVHRFRIAPQVDAIVRQARATGRLKIEAARIGAVSLDGAVIKVALRRKDQTKHVADFDAVIVTTGPAHGSILDSQPFLQRAGADGILSVDPTGLGLWCNRKSEVLNPQGEPEAGLYLAGPLARGTFGELMGLPQVGDHAKTVAQTILAKLAARPSFEARAHDGAA